MDDRIKFGAEAAKRATHHQLKPLPRSAKLDDYIVSGGGHSGGSSVGGGGDATAAMVKSFKPVVLSAAMSGASFKLARGATLKKMTMLTAEM